MSHLQGQGNLIHKSCSVVFTVLIPEAYESGQYILFTSHGEHSHPPPPPKRTPADIAEEISQVVRRLNDPDLTLSMSMTFY